MAARVVRGDQDIRQRSRPDLIVNERAFDIGGMNAGEINALVRVDMVDHIGSSSNDAAARLDAGSNTDARPSPA